MVDINPLFKLISELRMQMESGLSTKSALELYLQKNEGEFCGLVRQWFIGLQHQSDNSRIIDNCTSPYRKVFFQILESGFKGQMIYDPLCQLEEEVNYACEQELELALQRLPFKLMVPMLILLFPAYLILLIGPIIKQLMEGFNL
ncbi:MAG: hypothetical protein SGJ18_14580 [Pseudomonadota bacterium]|nr:hypothetical protein [Pseudomonadota bacterium]